MITGRPLIILWRVNKSQLMYPKHYSYYMQLMLWNSTWSNRQIGGMLIQTRKTEGFSGQVKNNEANVLQNGPKIIYLWYISALWLLTWISHHSRINSLNAIFLSCLIIFDLTLSRLCTVDKFGLSQWWLLLYSSWVVVLIGDHFPQGWVPCNSVVSRTGKGGLRDQPST